MAIVNDAPTPTPSPSSASSARAETDAVSVVQRFLAAMAAGDSAGAAELIADDIEYVNVGLPAIHGAHRVRRVLALLDRPAWGFDVVTHSIAATGDTVLTERTDVLTWGRWRSQFWVWGRFEVDNGRITLWRDSFDFLDLAIANLRGLIAIVIPSLTPALPSPDDAPGRRAQRGQRRGHWLRARHNQ